MIVLLMSALLLLVVIVVMVVLFVVVVVVVMVSVEKYCVEGSGGWVRGHWIYGIKYGPAPRTHTVNT